MTKKVEKREIDGILLVNKPLGSSSNHVLQKVKRRFNAKKAGHTGSLDPLATGMLPICFGEATKFSQYLLDSDKTYEVTVNLTGSTTTGDVEGEVLDNTPAGAIHKIATQQLKDAIQSFVGEINQIPPMYSALKHKGQPLYKYARKGETIERKSRVVTIFSIKQLQDLPNDNGEIKLVVHCSKGTYIRTLAEDIGRKLGCGAHTTRLHRTVVSPYQGSTMHTFEQLGIGEEPSADFEKLDALLLPMDSAISTLPKVMLDKTQTKQLSFGQPVHCDAKDELVRFYDEFDSFLGVGNVDPVGNVVKRRLVSR